jgi:hypothetical protein
MLSVKHIKYSASTSGDSIKKAIFRQNVFESSSRTSHKATLLVQNGVSSAAVKLGQLRSDPPRNSATSLPLIYVGLGYQRIAS